MSSLGLRPEDFAEEVVEVWPDNWQAVMVFETLATQWRVGPGGAYGLDYNVLPEIWRRTKTAPRDRDQVFNFIRVMEDAALDEMRKP